MADPAPQPSAPRDYSEASLTPTADFTVPAPRRNSSINTAPVAWDSDPAQYVNAQYASGEQSNGRLTPAQQTARSRPASEGGGSRSGRTPSTIHDQGDGELLRRELQDRGSPPPPIHTRSPSESRRSTAELVAQTGTFPTTNGALEPGSSFNVDETLSFETAIRAAFKVSASNTGGEYLPIDAFNRIVTRDRVRQELSLLVPHSIPAEKLDWYTDQIWDPASRRNSISRTKTHESRSSHEPRPTTRRKIFTILALIQRVKDILHFIHNELHDDDLPFLLSDGLNPGTRQLQRKGRDNNLYPITIVSSWPTYMLEVFNDYQWKLLSPYFTLSTKTKPEVLHYSFEDGTVLPLIEDREIASGDRGGYGDVWRVKIHPAHHNCSHDGTSDQDNPPYAIKRLRRSNKKAFRDEVSNLKRFSSRDHLHLIKLLVTFEWRKEYYLLFPCADGNLLDFWKRYRTVEELPRDHGLALWFSSQCLGLAEGLNMIHAFEVKQDDFLDIHPHEQEKTHGRHGDLKPENILWFRPVGPYRPPEADKGNMGVLKISDFGLTKFHRTRSMLSGQNNGKITPVSPTYRAPEYDIDQGFDQSYDIWTLGCVLLEFVAWYVMGWDEVERFSRSRAADDYREIKEDVFFNNVEIVREDGEKKEVEIGAQAKKAVYEEFQVLYQHERCSDFILDLLDFIENNLLRMGPWKRAKCGEIVDKLNGMYETCKRDVRYCTEKARSDCPRARTDLSLLSASAMPYSDRMKARIIHQTAVPRVQQDSFPSVASQLSATPPPRPPTSLPEQIVGKLSNLIDSHSHSHRSDEHHGIREPSRRLTPLPSPSIPSVTISPPTQTSPAVESGNAHATSGTQTGDSQIGTANESALPSNPDTRTSTPRGEPVPQQNRDLQGPPVNDPGGDSTDDSPRKTGDEPAPQAEEPHGNPNRILANVPPPGESGRPPTEKEVHKRSFWGQICCVCFRRRRDVHSESASQLNTSADREKEDVRRD